MPPMPDDPNSPLSPSDRGEPPLRSSSSWEEEQRTPAAMPHQAWTRKERPSSRLRWRSDKPEKAERAEPRFGDPSSESTPYEPVRAQPQTPPPPPPAEPDFGQGRWQPPPEQESLAMQSPQQPPYQAPPQDIPQAIRPPRMRRTAEGNSGRHGGGGSGGDGGNGGGNGPGGGRGRRKDNGKKRRSLGWRLVRWTVVAGLWSCVGVALLVAWYARDLPSLDEVSSATRRPSLLIQASDGAIIANYGDLYGDVIDVSEMPAWLPGAVVSIEDRRFYNHIGVDPLGLLRAVVVNIQRGHMAQGGSTLTQQVVKNVFLSQERTLKRKVQELLLALWLERTFTKQQILTLYLNRVYLGAGTYGVEAAAQRYFGVSARNVTPFQAAVLAGLLKAPSRYNPANNPEVATGRASVVLNAMVENGVLSQAEAQQALASAPVALAHVSQSRPGRYFSDWVMEQVDELVGAVNQDLTIHTTLDSTIQNAAEEALAKTLESKGSAMQASEGAVVVLSPDGAIQAMVGGRSYASSQYNRAVQALRQPGSSFKPFVYLAGLESGLRPDDTVEDAPITIKGWSPENFDHRYHGPMVLRDAVAESINTVAVRVSERAGLAQVIEVAHRLGITADLQPTPSLALGTQETAVLPLVSAYAPFANGGYLAAPFGITTITTRDGTVLFQYQPAAKKQVIRPQDVGAMNSLLSGVIERGTGRRAAIGRPAAGKTGTSADYRDAWFVGYTSDYVAGVWVGNDNNSPMKKVTGGSLPAEVWRSVMLAAHQNKPVRDLPAGETDDFIGRLLRSVLGDDTPPPRQAQTYQPQPATQDPQSVTPNRSGPKPPPLFDGKIQPDGSLGHKEVIDLFNKN